MQAGFDAMKGVLKAQKAPGFRWDVQQRKDEDHGSIVMRAHDRGLRYPFSDWPVSTDPVTGNFAGSRKDLEAHFARLSKRFGGEILAPEILVNQIGHQRLQPARLAEALDYFDSVPIRHMLDHAREACALIAGRNRADIHSDRVLQLALTRLVEIVGEAAGRVSPESQARFPAVPW